MSKYSPNKNYRYIDAEIISIINKVVNIEDRIEPSMHFSDYYLVKFEKDYQFDFISRGISNPNRLSGLNINTLKKLDFNELPPREDFRKKKGTLLKTGKFLKHLLGDSQDYDFVKLAKKLADELVFVDFSIFKITDKPSDIYSSGFSYDFTSCMQNLDEDYFDIYDDLENCRLVYILEDYHYLVGRALLWDNINLIDKYSGEIIKKIKLMDRIYAKDYETKIKFVHYAKKHGYCYRLEGKYYYPDGKLIDLWNYNLVLELPDYIGKGYYRATPYFDTFQKLSRKGNKLYLSYDYIEGFEFLDTLISTNGQSYLSHRFVCYLCENPIINEDDAIYVDSLDDYVCPDCFENECVICEYCNEVVLRDDAIITEDGKTFCCEHCANEKNYYFCENCESYCHLDDMIEIDKVIFVCKHCAIDYQCDFCDNYSRKIKRFYTKDLRVKNICLNCIKNEEITYIPALDIYSYKGNKDLIIDQVRNFFIDKFIYYFESDFSIHSPDILFFTLEVINKLLDGKSLFYLYQNYQDNYYGNIVNEIAAILPNFDNFYMVVSNLYQVFHQLVLRYKENKKLFYHLFYRLKFNIIS